MVVHRQEGACSCELKIPNKKTTGGSRISRITSSKPRHDLEYKDGPLSDGI